MAKRGRKPRFMYFDVQNFIKDLRRELTRVTKELHDELYDKVVAKASSLPFKDNEVRLASGRTVSDAERRGALLNSIVKQSLEWKKNGVMKYVVEAMNHNFKNSHIGLYYEYGTGEKIDKGADPEYESLLLRHWNPFRAPHVGSRIVSRSKYIDGGVWTDIGGNKRITRSPGGVYNSRFREYIGEDIQAYHWFRDAYREVAEGIDKRYLEVIKKVNPAKYIYVRPQFVLGVD